MIEISQGDLLHANAEALVNTVNCVGVMGRGVALQFRNAYPENFKFYKAACDAKTLRPGMVLTFDRHSFDKPHYIINFPTKDHWKGKSRLEYIDTGLAALIAEVERLGIQSVALPPLGCGLGGLDWAEVRPRIEAAFATLPNVRVLLYEPAGAPDPADMAHSDKTPVMTPARATLLSLMRRYLAGLMDNAITLLEVQKLMYFMQEGGERLDLKYTKALYGPYAQNLRHLLNTLEGHYILGFGDAEDAPSREIKLHNNAGAEAAAYLQSHETTQQRLDRVAALIDGFETPFGMELLATVHWVASREGATNTVEAAHAVHQWNKRKKMFSERQICIAFDVLARNGWIKANR